MNRLTYRIPTGTLAGTVVVDDYRAVLDKLASYEDTGLTHEEVAEIARAKEEGRLMVLPCAIGDSAYIVARLTKEIHDAVVLGIEVFGRVWHLMTDRGLCSSDHLGISTFLTREAAEAALAERTE